MTKRTPSSCSVLHSDEHHRDLAAGRVLCGGPATVHTAAAAIGGHRERHGREEDVEREALGEGEEEGAEP